MTRAAIVALVAVVALVCVSAFEHDGAVDGCDWSGSGDGGSDGVRSVYLRCNRGTVLWRYPRGAIRILLSLPNSPAFNNRMFRTCIKISGPARLFQETSGKLVPIYSPFDSKTELSHRCFRSQKDVIAFFMEAEDNNSLTNVRVKLQYNLEPKSLKGGTLRVPDEEEECRPCSLQELGTVYCESNLVARGTLTAVHQRYIDMEESQLTFRVGVIIRQVRDGEEPIEHIGPMTRNRNVHVRVPAACDAQHGQGEFVIMAKRRFGDYILVCAPRTEEWVDIIKSGGMRNAPCILKASSHKKET